MDEPTSGACNACRRHSPTMQTYRFFSFPVLLSSPPPLFPPAGLDSSIASEVMNTVKQLQQQTGSTILVTIHQPAMRIFDLFDGLVVLSQGRLAYFGPAHAEPLRFFERQGFACDGAMLNAAEALLEIVSGRVKRRSGAGATPEEEKEAEEGEGLLSLAASLVAGSGADGGSSNRTSATGSGCEGAAGGASPRSASAAAAAGRGGAGGDGERRQPPPGPAVVVLQAASAITPTAAAAVGLLPGRLKKRFAAKKANAAAAAAGKTTTSLAAASCASSSSSAGDAASSAAAEQQQAIHASLVESFASSDLARAHAARVAEELARGARQREAAELLAAQARGSPLAFISASFGRSGSKLFSASSSGLAAAAGDAGGGGADAGAAEQQQQSEQRGDDHQLSAAEEGGAPQKEAAELDSHAVLAPTPGRGRYGHSAAAGAGLALRAAAAAKHRSPRALEAAAAAANTNKLLLHAASPAEKGAPEKPPLYANNVLQEIWLLMIHRGFNRYGARSFSSFSEPPHCCAHPCLLRRGRLLRLQLSCC